MSAPIPLELNFGHKRDGVIGANADWVNCNSTIQRSARAAAISAAVPMAGEVSFKCETFTLGSRKAID